MPADGGAAREELRALLEAEQSRADRELRRIKLAWLVCGLCFAAALVPWLFLGGRAQFVAQDSGFGAAVLVPAWLALLGVAAATVATALFLMRAMRASLGNIIERDVRKNHGSPRRRG